MSCTWPNRRYGHLAPGTDDIRLRIGPGQNLGGFPIGIIFIDGVRYPYLPGNVCNGWTYDFPVRMRAVEGLEVRELFAADDSLRDRVIDTCLALQREGVRAISSGCGFFGTFQREVREALDIPVGLSSLIQVPWIEQVIKSDERIGVLTASAPDITPKLLEGCGIEHPERLVIRGLQDEPEFSAIVDSRGEFDNGGVRQEMIAATRELMATPGAPIGAILLECSDMPPYASDVQRAAGVPVFDFITLIRWLESSVAQTPYQGFL